MAEFYVYERAVVEPHALEAAGYKFRFRKFAPRENSVCEFGLPHFFFRHSLVFEPIARIFHVSMIARTVFNLNKKIEKVIKKARANV